MTGLEILAIIGSVSIVSTQLETICNSLNNMGNTLNNTYHALADNIKLYNLEKHANKLFDEGAYDTAITLFDNNIFGANDILKIRIEKLASKFFHEKALKLGELLPQTNDFTQQEIYNKKAKLLDAAIHFTPSSDPERLEHLENEIAELIFRVQNLNSEFPNIGSDDPNSNDTFNESTSQEIGLESIDLNLDVCHTGVDFQNHDAAAAA